MIDVATALDIGFVGRFVTFPTFLRWTDDVSEAALAPVRYDQSQVDKLAAQEEAEARAMGAKSQGESDFGFKPLAASKPERQNDAPRKDATRQGNNVVVLSRLVA